MFSKRHLETQTPKRVLKLTSFKTQNKRSLIIYYFWVPIPLKANVRRGNSLSDFQFPLKTVKML